MVSSKGLGKLKATVVVCAGDALDHTDIDQHGDVAIDAALGQAASRLEDLGDHDRPTCSAEDLYEYPTLRGVTLIGARETESNRIMHRASESHS